MKLNCGGGISKDKLEVGNEASTVGCTLTGLQSKRLIKKPGV